MSLRSKKWILIAAAILCLVAGVAVGSVPVSPADVGRIFANKLWGAELPADFPRVYPGMIWEMRFPRVVMAFLVGAGLAVSGAVMQSVLKNPLASSYGLGVSSGAGLGAAVLIIMGLGGGWLGIFLMPVVCLICGLATVSLAMGVANKIDRGLSNNTIILTGMVLSLFLNALMSTLAATNPKYTQRITLWQLGSFSAKEWIQVLPVAIVVPLCILIFCAYSRELDLMTFGEEQAAALGVNLKKTKWILICVVALLTGTSVAFAGIIGFVDLVAPHVIRRFFGPEHRRLIPLSALFGGTFMVCCDLAARTVTIPHEVPIGSITALIGAPFFIYVFLTNRKGEKHPC